MSQELRLVRESDKTLITDGQVYYGQANSTLDLNDSDDELAEQLALAFVTGPGKSSRADLPKEVVPADGFEVIETETSYTLTSGRFSFSVLKANFQSFTGMNRTTRILAMLELMQLTVFAAENAGIRVRP